MSHPVYGVEGKMKRSPIKITFGRALLLGMLIISPSIVVAAPLELPRVFGDNMVLQRDKPVNVWGWSKSGELVSVTLNGQSAKTTTAADGTWSVQLPAMPVCAKPLEFQVQSDGVSITYQNVLIGDVWICSGQSNMESAAGGIIDSDLDMPQAGIHTVRCLTLPLHSSPVPLDNFPIEQRNPFYVELKGVWKVSSPETAKDFTAVGYHFARIVSATTGVPIGLIDNSWGGSVVETWISRETLNTIPEMKPHIEHDDEEAAAYDPVAELSRKMEGWKRAAEKAKQEGKPEPEQPVVSQEYPYRQDFPGGCFNGLIAPIQKFQIKGVLFYQGENNCVGGTARPNLYAKTYAALIPDWRKAFNDPDLPFGIIQLCSFGEPCDENETEENMLSMASGIREAQLSTHLKTKNTGIVPTYDLGHVQMHSPFKRPIGERAARWALDTVYHVKGINYEIPIMESWTRDGGRILLTFAKGTHPSSPYGMRVPPKGFTIAGADRHFYPAHLDNVAADTFAVSSAYVSEPVAVRYAWGVHPVGNFGNHFAPTPPFRTDDWPAWNDAPLERNAPQSINPEVPTRETATAQAWQRKTAAANKVLEVAAAREKNPKQEKSRSPKQKVEKKPSEPAGIKE
ncbi:MAG: hypothetical protein DWI25_09510 [Planctomycetota bacterium]|nr:MAG: hypothetical protein DWI25_09510 [Planctomycetota bacterium]